MVVPECSVAVFQPAKRLVHSYLTQVVSRENV
jgi:hypothetical protein